MFRTIRVMALALAAFGVSTVAPLAAQDQPTSRFEGRIDVNEVLLDVLVTDARGNVIVGLGPQDFTVREDGKPVELTGVTFYSDRRLIESPRAMAQKGIAVDNAPADRFFILFFDDQKSASADAPQLLANEVDAAQRAKEWVLKDRQPSDWVAVVSYDNKLKIQQDFTRDGRVLAEAIGDAVQGKDREGNWPSRIAKGEGPSLYQWLPQGNALRDQTGQIYDGLRVLADAAGHVRGRKNLILFTNGFGRVNSFGQYIPDPRYYPDMSHALNDNNVAVYAVDLLPSSTQHPLGDAMSQLANDTGGQYYNTFTTFSTPLRQIAKENSGYYLLSYRRERSTGPAGFQKVEVKTTNPEFKVRARKGYSYGDEKSQ
jgi:VWFA-related protein